MKKDVLTTFEAAKICKVNPFTIRNWIEAGKLRAYKTLGGHRRIYRTDLEKFLEEHNMVPDRSPIRGKMRALIVDDEQVIIDLISATITEMAGNIDIEIQTALNGFDAGRAVSSFKPHLIILDLKMPGLDGFTVCQQIKSDPQTKDIEIIALTGYYIEENVRRIKECGASKCLKKPLDVDELESAIWEVFDRINAQEHFSRK